jgi:hypothetical protein
MRLMGMRIGGWSAAALLVLGGCGGEESGTRSRAPAPLPSRVVADSGRSIPLAVFGSDSARAWMAGVSRREPARARPASGSLARPSSLDVPIPEPHSDTLSSEVSPAPSLAMDEDLKPPIPMGSAPLRLPPLRRGAAWVELDVRIDENGGVSDALWADGSADSSIVAATVACALAMRFHPALRHGVPIAVWCRQRFEIGREGVPRPAPGD